jgi:hypothetical protein
MRRLLILGAVIACMVSIVSVPASAVSSHCPGGWTSKVQAVGSNLDGVVLPSGTQFCIKASNSNTGILNTSNFPQGFTLYEILQYINFLNGGSQVPSVSYYVIYDCAYYSCSS